MRRTPVSERLVPREASLTHGFVADVVPPAPETASVCKCAKVLLDALGERRLRLQLHAEPRSHERGGAPVLKTFFAGERE